MIKKQAKEQKIQNLLEELKVLLSEVGWNKKDLAKKVVQSREESLTDTVEETEKEIKKEYQKIIKLFNRLPKNDDKLNFYISFIIRENKHLNFCKLPQLDNFDYDQKVFLNGIAEISKAFLVNNKK
ncbi:hypothetical protein RO21_01930 [[Actinobacillus] muris]|uniref:Uncharacterized protein n=1 Tax=Muribacter muris TaxID=67855 RepID=A0A0J5P9M6_9PAST|nr:hypothetical protein [Muribacter muris]KMK52244.1 hypothetical protein RO21_01930 [[Actinobacillus] muris] [Muribacter muris]